MKLSITAIFDEEVRKQIHTQILSEAKGVARSEIDKTIGAELKRVVNGLAQEFSSGYRGNPSYRVTEVLRETIREILTNNWEKISALISERVETLLEGKLKNLAEAAVTKAVEAKMAKLTVWKASEEDDYVRRVVRSEVKKMLAGE